MFEISTEIQINSKPDRVWKVLTDFNNWSKWNPIVISTTGNSSVGEKLSITMKGPKPDKPGPSYSPQITIMDENKTLRWRAHMGASFIMRNDKEIQLIQNGDSTTVVHKELFSGLMFKLMCSQMEKGVPPMLNAMNKALKSECEK